MAAIEALICRRREFLALHEIEVLTGENNLAVLVEDLDLLDNIAMIGALGIIPLFADGGFDGNRIADEEPDG